MSVAAVVIILLILVIVAAAGYFYYISYLSSSSLSNPNLSQSGSSILPPTPVAPHADATPTPIASTPTTPPPPAVVPSTAAPVPPPPDCATDPVGYYYYYAPDVKAAGVDAKTHWDTTGYKEGRKSCWPPPPQWNMTPNTAYYLGGLQQSHIIAQDNNTDPDSCKSKCSATGGCKGFFYQARGGLNGGGFSFPAKSCVYTDVPLWGGGAPQSDSYYLQ